MTAKALEHTPNLRIERCGVALTPIKDTLDSAGVLNPASARTRDGTLLLYPRMVETGNISRIGVYEYGAGGTFTRVAIALEAEADYEFRTEGDGQGCEDPRVTFLPILDRYIMAYTAFGANGPRIALAVSHDARTWTRLGLMDFSATDYEHCYDKDAAFFPEPVYSPSGVESLAFYHRPSHERHGFLSEDIRIGYIALDGILADINNIRRVQSSVQVLEAGGTWGRIKVGAGTPPIKTSAGWLSIYHGVDRHAGEAFGQVSLIYRAGVILHDLRSPHIVHYVSPHPLLEPEREDERHGVVDNVVFPTAIDTYNHAPGTAMIYYGMADFAIGAALLEFHELERGS